jgi:hypothetical protein
MLVNKHAERFDLSMPVICIAIIYKVLRDYAKFIFIHPSVKKIIILLTRIKRFFEC